MSPVPVEDRIPSSPRVGGGGVSRVEHLRLRAPWKRSTANRELASRGGPPGKEKASRRTRGRRDHAWPIQAFQLGTGKRIVGCGPVISCRHQGTQLRTVDAGNDRERDRTQNTQQTCWQKFLAHRSLSEEADDQGSDDETGSGKPLTFMRGNVRSRRQANPAPTGFQDPARATNRRSWDPRSGGGANERPERIGIRPGRKRGTPAVEPRRGTRFR